MARTMLLTLSVSNGKGKGSAKNRGRDKHGPALKSFDKKLSQILPNLSKESKM